MCMWALLRGVIVWALGCCLALGAWAQDLVPVPTLSGRVVDLTTTLPSTTQQQLDQQLGALEQQTGAQVVVLLVNTTQPEDIAAYAFRVADTWKIGRRQVGDGLLLVVAVKDRKVRIEVAKRLEGAIPDLMAKRIINEHITPAFRQGDYGGGLSAAVTAIGRLIQGENLPAPNNAATGSASGATGDAGPDLLTWVVLALVMLPAFARAIVGVFGRKLGPLLTSAGAGGLTWLLTASLPPTVVAVVAGFIIALVVGVLGFMAPSVSRGSRGSWPGSGGGWGGGGGGFGGGSSGGGGFSSGGGGNFGGGGASGSW